MTQLSRRHVLAAPLAVAVPRPRAGPAPRIATPQRRAPTDPLVTAIHTFTSQHADNAAREREWQHHEHALAATCAPLTLTQATRSGLPAARTMRRLARRIAATRRRLQRTATRLSHTPADTLDGALAKLDLALHLLEPSDPTDTAGHTAAALLQGGLADVRHLLSPRS